MGRVEVAVRHGLPGILAGGDAQAFAERGGQVALAREAAARRNLGGREVGLGKQLAGLLQTPVPHIAMGRRADLLAEAAGEMIGAESPSGNDIAFLKT
jgi:hypothetical protein